MGDRLGRYVVLKHIATGGMADVLLGRSQGYQGFERHVVLKRIRPEHARDERFIRMFLDEARLAANLHHQHIVQVHDVGEAAGEYFIAMEYIHGEDVRTILTNAAHRRTHVPVGLAVAIVSAAAAGLHYAHERRGSDRRPLGIVHRDVSPSNLIVGYDGSIKIVDFGIAKASATEDTRSGTLKGKLAYMSPEQCKSRAIDRRSDVYSLGVVLYELVTTSRLYKGDNDYLVMEQIVNGRITAPHVRRPDLPAELSGIIMRALATEVSRRYASADELRAALDQFASRAGLTASTSTVAAFMRKHFGERPEPWLEAPAALAGFDQSQKTLPRSRVMPLPSEPTGVRDASEDVPAGVVAAASELGSGPVVSPATRPSAPQAAAEEPEITIEPAPQRASSPSLAMAAPPTDSKLGWESQKRLHAGRGMTSARLASYCVPAIALLAFASWRISSGVAGSAAAIQTAPLVVAAVPSPPPVASTPGPAPALALPAPAMPSRERPSLGDSLIASVASDHSSELRRCVVNEKLPGELTAWFEVDADGKVSKVDVRSATQRLGLAPCVQRVVEHWVFPPQPAGATQGARGRYTLSFP